MKFEYSPYIALQVKDHEKAVDFYKRVLGMEFIEAGNNDTYLKTGVMTFVFENNPGGAHRKVTGPSADQGPRPPGTPVSRANTIASCMSARLELSATRSCSGGAPSMGAKRARTSGRPSSAP